MGDGRFVGFADLAFGPIKLDAVAIERNVAAGNHDCRNALRQSIQSQRRSGQHPAKIHLATGLADTGRTSADDGRAGRAQVHAQGDFLPRFRKAEAVQKRQRIGGADLIGHLANQSARAAGAECHAAFGHHLLDIDFCHGCLVCKGVNGDAKV